MVSFEFSKDFRNEGMSRFHNPEFTQVELYVAYKDYNWMMDFVERMLEQVAISLHGSTRVPVGEHIIDFKRPWAAHSHARGLLRMRPDLDLSGMNLEQMQQAARGLGIQIDATMGKGKKLLTKFLGGACGTQAHTAHFLLPITRLR